MELDTLKTIWQHQTIATTPLQEKEILRMVRSVSKTPASIMKRNLRMELFSVIALYSFAMLYYIIATTFTWVAAFLGVLAILYFIYYSKKKQILEQMTGYSDTIRDNLEGQVKMLARYMKWYGWIAAILTPLIFIIVLIVWKGENNLTAWNWPGNQTFYFLFAAVGIAFSVISFLINKWYVYHLYGKHLEELRRMLAELSAEGERQS